MQRFGRYEVIRLIASGGMADVYLGRHVAAAGIVKHVVIKRMHAERAKEPRFVDLFLREARVGVDLNHENIVSTLDFAAAGNDLLLILEYVDGTDLASLLAVLPETRLEPETAVHIVAEISSALQYAHRRGIVHLDVTPRNILLARSGGVKLADFGIAALHHERIGVRGTLAYMAPEQARGEEVGPATDIFALGLVLWEALAGHGPHRGAAERVLAEVQRGDVPPLPAWIEPELAGIVAKATASRGSERFADARSFRQALDRYLGSKRTANVEAESARDKVSALIERWIPSRDAGDQRPAPGPHTSPAATRPETRPDTRPPPSASRASASPPAPAATGARRVRWLLGASTLIALAVMVTMVWFVDSQRAADRSVTDVEDDAAIVVPAPVAEPDAATTATDALATSDVDGAPTDARAIDAPPVDAPRTRPAALDAGASSAAPRRRVSVGARPWAHVRINDGATRYETPFTVELPAGRHVLTFENPHGFLDRQIVIQVQPDRDLELFEILTPAP